MQNGITCVDYVSVISTEYTVHKTSIALITFVILKDQRLRIHSIQPVKVETKQDCKV